MLPPDTFSMQARLFFNPNDSDVILVSHHPHRSKQPLHWARVRCRPGRLVELPHGLYDPEWADGHPLDTRPLQAEQLFGTDKDRAMREKREFIDFRP